MKKWFTLALLWMPFLSYGQEVFSVDSLLSVMSLKEKIGQCVLFASRGMVTGPGESMPYDDFIINGTCGNVFGVRDLEENTRIQKLAVNNTPHGIPLLVGMDVIHGFKTIFPINLAASCSWDVELVEEMAKISSLEASAAGINWVYSPMCDISRDPRWGRVSEGAGEDPYLGGEMASAMVRGYQGGNLGDAKTVMACVKHFAAYGAPEGGREYNTVDMSERTLREVYLPPYEAAIKAGAGSVMTSFNEIAGVPSTANRWLLNDLLRKEWGFDGLIVTDYSSIAELVNHGVSEDRSEATLLSAQAGVNMDMVSNCYFDYMEDLVLSGKLPVALVDSLCRGVLKMKQRLGLFEDPYRYCRRGADKPYSKEAMAAARKLAGESMVLLSNDGTLPIKIGKRITVVGPFVDNVREMIGSWTPTADKKVGVTVKAGLEKRFGSKNVRCYKELPEKDFGDVIVVTIGLPQDKSGEASSMSSISIPAEQKQLLRKAASLGRPIVALVFTGRPLDLSEELPLVNSLLVVWQPGTTGGDALADVISGDVNPSGKLTMSFPRNVGQIPVYYNAKNTGRPQNAVFTQSSDKYTSRYIDIPNSPLFPFGYGLSYTTFSYSKPSLSSESIYEGENLEAKVTVTNTGTRAGTEVVQLYVRDLVGSVTRPLKELKGFRRITLKPGESADVSFTITPEMLSFYGLDMEFRPEPGQFDLWIGGDSNAGNKVSFRLMQGKREQFFVVSDASAVDDCILRRSELTYHDELFWTGWNFGASQTLDAGYGIAMWNMWHGNILLRFDLRGVPCEAVEDVSFRIYKPKNLTQKSPKVSISVYEVNPENAGWREGQKESLPCEDGASWLYRDGVSHWAGGASGCSVPGVDYNPVPIGRALANKYEGDWLEFSLPKELVQRWLDNPETNSGVLIKTDEDSMGDHVLFYSSEHSSGKGPELIIRGRPGIIKHPLDEAKPINPRVPFPTRDSTFLRYLKERDFRYPLWAKDPVVNMTPEQQLYPYYWDIVVYGDFILPYSYYPFSQSILGLDQMIEKRDIDGLKKFQVNRLRYLHIWEYIREQRWYDCGDLAEIMSPLQAAYIWLGSREHNGLSFDGVLYKVHKRGTPNLSEEKIRERMDKEVQECFDNLVLTPSQGEAVSKFIKEMEYQRCQYYNKCNEAAQRVFELMDKKNSGPKMMDALGDFMNYHDIYLFYDSYWQMKRWTFLMDNTDIVSLCKFWKKQKYGEYSPERIEKRYRMCQGFYPASLGTIDIEKKNKIWE